MSDKFRGLHGPITTDAANAEPERDRLFGSSYDARQRQLRARGQQGGIDPATYRPSRKPMIDRGTIRAANSSTREGVDREPQARRAGPVRAGADRTLGSD